VIPQTAVGVENVEGRSTAADAIVRHMTQPVENSTDRAPQHDWKLIGRFGDAEAAQKATEKAQAKNALRQPVGAK